ncbi:MAG: hypothetical protein ACJ8DI_25725 [Ktedonobacteraceae bacterium]
MCSSQFRTFTLPQLLPEGHALIVNQRAYFFDHYVVSQLLVQPCGLIAQQLFSDQELFAFVALMEAWPHYCPYETLLAALSDRTIDQARQLVHQALEGHNLDKVLNPLRNLLARCRPRLHDFKIDIGSRRGLGYQLQRIEGMTRTY